MGPDTQVLTYSSECFHRAGESPPGPTSRPKGPGNSLPRLCNQASLGSATASPASRQSEASWRPLPPPRQASTSLRIINWLSGTPNDFINNVYQFRRSPEK